MTIPLRSEQRIDERSYLNTCGAASPSAVVIFVHGLFGESKDTWKDIATTLFTQPVLANVDYGFFGYDSPIVDFKSPRVVVEGLVLWCRTQLSKYPQIFFIAHSLGGVIVRGTCAMLISSDKAEDLKLLQQISRSFLIAPAVSVTWPVKVLSHLPFLSRLNSKFGYLNTKESVDGYNRAIARKESQRLVRPKFSIFVGDDDKLVSKPEAWALTPDDTYEGFVPGDHGTVKSGQTINSTLIRSITQQISVSLTDGRATIQNRLLREVQTLSRIQRAHGVQNNTGNETRPMAGDAVDVVVMSCSFTKRTDGNVNHPKRDQEPILDRDLWVSVLQMRMKVKQLIEEGRIEGIELKEGNRVARFQNNELILGPDFGGAMNERRFLPAYWRYAGRTYRATKDEWETFLDQPLRTRPDVLIMSGLYGLLPATEYIQNYDCHITDLDRDTGQTVREYWGSLMTDVLVARLEDLEHQGYRIGRVIDLLSEASYQAAINWQSIYPRWSVLHRVFEKRAGRDALGNLGVWVRKLISSPSTIKNVRAGEFYEDPDFTDPDRIAFETRLGESTLPVAREG